MDLGLHGKVALITGASRGIGKGITLGFASEGCRMAICARGAHDLERAAAELRTRGVEVLSLPLDITRQESAGQLVDGVLDRFGRLDILVNSAGGNRRGPFQAISDEDWDALLALNLMGHVRVTRAAIPAMLRQGSGVILFIASIYGRESGGPTLSLYNTTKSGVISLAKVLAVELAPHGIRVNSVAPGSIRFPGGSWDRRCQEDPVAMAAFIQRELPLGRFGTVEEVANVAVFLASERASLVTGACVNVDGCQSRSLI